MLKQKKGWIRIVEATIALLIIFGFLLTAISQTTEKPNFQEAIYKIQAEILEKAIELKEVRSGILNDNTGPLNDFISKSDLPKNLEYETKICDIDESCPPSKTVENKEIYVSEIVVKDDEKGIKNKKVAFFVWRK